MSENLPPPDRTAEESMAILARHNPHVWAAPKWHLRRLKNYLRQLRSHLAGKKEIECRELAARCRRDARASRAMLWKRLYRQFAELFDLAAGIDPHAANREADGA